MNVLFRIIAFSYSCIFFLRRKAFVKNIGKNDLVLDLGSGDKPFWRADVIVDKYLEDDRQRSSGPVLLDKNKLFIKADVENLPFKDKVFDFVYCSHLLEHVENPVKAINEITRVGKSGYIEVPRAFLELLNPFPSHLWLCELEGKTLIFRRKEKEKNFYLMSLEKLGRKLYRESLFRYLLIKNIEHSFICFYWKGSINYKIDKIDTKPYVYKYRKEIVKDEYFVPRFAVVFYKLFYILTTALFFKKKRIEKIIYRKAK